MPCFLVGEGAARMLGSAMHIPVYRTSHQIGHILAALYSADRPELLGQSFLAFHVSGGTTDCVHCRPEQNPDFSIISDIAVSAEYAFQNYHIFCGEGSYGGDGFVTAVSGNEIQWLAFWEDANPFIKIQSHENQLEITNNLHEVWQFDLSDPKSITVSVKEDL